MDKKETYYTRQALKNVTNSINQFNIDMQISAKIENYELAANLRDRITKLCQEKENLMTKLGYAI
jgi:protein-arginine kinase activator protein McsA